ncbi:hypothetical protein EOD39_19547 [Acipenser ruthenus]|uniref:Uncharacterized protein n=1 Tax=Acipenser ruthenus TaxID=7906 RepID=A0A444UXV1_ACIRT|nr:hypothetical protein EOD39_19547 [Acipenser ruthenus]
MDAAATALQRVIADSDADTVQIKYQRGVGRIRGNEKASCRGCERQECAELVAVRLSADLATSLQERKAVFCSTGSRTFLNARVSGGWYCGLCQQLEFYTVKKKICKPVMPVTGSTFLPLRRCGEIRYTSTRG